MKVSSKDFQISDHQALRLLEIGSQLKLIREQKGISLQKIRQITLISERHLRAIEEGNINSLPEPVYIQGFIRKYAKALGVNNIAEQFPLTKILPKTSWLKSSELRPFHLYLIYILLIATSVGTLSNIFNPAANYSSISDSETQLSDAARLKPNTKGNTSKLVNRKEQTVNKPNSLKPQVKTVNLGIMMKGESWMRIEVDGIVKFEGILSEGTNKVWGGNKNIILRAGNAGAILLEFNQYPPMLLGQVGEVVQKTFNSSYKPPNIRLSASSLPENLE